MKKKKLKSLKCKYFLIKYYNRLRHSSGLAEFKKESSCWSIKILHVCALLQVLPRAEETL